MTGYDFNRPFADSSTFPLYSAIDAEVASRYGGDCAGNRDEQL